MVNWLWDIRLTEKEIKKILKDINNPRFSIYTAKLLSRVNDPKYVFSLVNKIDFCRKWNVIKKEMNKDQWLKDKVYFWQTIYENLYFDFKEKGIKIRKTKKRQLIPIILDIAQTFKKRREKLGISQKQMAEKLGFGQQYISKIERGQENFSIESLNKIAGLLDLDLVIKFKKR